MANNKTFVSNNTLTIADNNTEALGSSVAGTEIAKILAGVRGVKLDANFERVILTENVANYKFLVTAGTGFQILAAADNSVVATISSINQNVKISFGNGSATLKQTGGTAYALYKADGTQISGANVPVSPASALSLVVGNIDGTATITDTVAQFTATLNDIAVDDSVTISDSISNINTDLALGSNSVLLNNIAKIDNFTISAGAVSATDITAIEAANGTGSITGTAITGINGTAAAIVQAIADIDTDPTNFDSTVAAGAVSATDITAIEAANGTGSITGTAITGINGTAAAIVQAIADIDTDPTNFDSTISGASTISNLAAIDSANGSGTITYSSVIDAVATMITNTGSYVKNGITATYQFTTTDANQLITAVTGATNVLDVNGLTTATQTSSAANGAPDASKFYLITGGNAGDADNTTNAAAKISAAATWTNAASVTTYVAIVDDNSTSIFKWIDAATAGAVAGELTLIGTIDVVLTSTDFVFV
jgi:hypothetical protein